VWSRPPTARSTVGGFQAGVVRTEVEEYDPGLNLWFIKAQMPIARGGLALAAANNGKLYAIGGFNPTFGVLVLVQEYDPAFDSWTTKANMPNARWDFGVTTASNGRIYAVGGFGFGQPIPAVDEYDPSTNTWAMRAPMPSGRSGLGATAAGNGKVYAVGGYNGSSYLNTVVAYDPATNTWAGDASMSVARHLLGVATAGNGRIYAVGGTNGTVVSNTEEATLTVLTVSSIAPDSGPAAGGTSVTITGTGFQTGATVTMGGVPATDVIVVDATQVTATTPALSPGTLNDIVVTNPGGPAVTRARVWLADFLDVPGSHLFHDWVEKLFRNGVTSGCGGGSFCLNAPVLRRHMAVFLLRSKEGASYTPPPATGIFDDVPPYDPLASWIEELVRRGITAGCSTSPPQFCPDNAVSRRGMAVFLLRTREGPSYTPPPATGVFDDVPAYDPFAKWIEELVRRGITAGCSTSPPLYCPNNAVSRGSMAVFLVRTFNLP